MRRNIFSVTLLAICPILIAQQPLPTSEASAAKSTTATTSSTAIQAKPNTLLDGTPVKLRIGRNISSADAKVGEHIDFEVLDEIQVMGIPVIAKGATASATITAAEPKKRMGRAGKLDLTLDYVRLIDNEKAALTATAGGSGGSHTGVMVGAMAATAIFTLGGSALFLLMHGKDITIPKGTETTAYVNGDMQLDISKFVATSSSSTTATASATPGQASISIESSPSGADIEIDGAFVGNTPSAVAIVPGNHQISVKKKGFTNWSRTLNVSGGSIHLNAELDHVSAKQ
jgi:hypothetical protein